MLVEAHLHKVRRRLRGEAKPIESDDFQIIGQQAPARWIRA